MTPPSSSSSYGSTWKDDEQRLQHQQQHLSVADGHEEKKSDEEQNEVTPLLLQQNEDFHRDPPPDKTRSTAKENNTKNKDNKTSSLIWTNLVFDWLTPLLVLGSTQQQLHADDVNMIQFPTKYDAQTLYDTFDQCWKDECQKNNVKNQNKKNNKKNKPGNIDNNSHNNNDNPYILLRALCRAFGWDLFQAGFLKLAYDLATLVGPMVLHAMIRFLQTPAAPTWQGLALTLAVTLSQLVMSLTLRHYFFRCGITGLAVRSALVLAIYQKALHLSTAERQRRSVGQITNLLSIDIDRLQYVTAELHSLWLNPLYIAVCVYVLWRLLGPASLAGLLSMLCTIPFIKYIAKIISQNRKKLMTSKDERVNINTEVLLNMKAIKLHAWEKPFLQKLQELRDQELTDLVRVLSAYTFSQVFSRSLTPLLVAMATFAAYIWLDPNNNQLDVATALTALALFSLLGWPLYYFPTSINRVVDSMVTLRRIQSFLLSEEHVPVLEGEMKETGIHMQGVAATYDLTMTPGGDGTTEDVSENNKNNNCDKSRNQSFHNETQHSSSSLSLVESSSASLCLSSINFECKPGELIVLVGSVGGGKSSFFNTILGETQVLRGTTNVKGSISYFAQSPFILNATLRENILFAKVDGPVDEDLYQRALECCALHHDLEMLPNGDLTEIGEKGINLSGGQKARVALARAVYHRATLTLVDDALAAVDAQISKHLFEEAICKQLLEQADGGIKRSVVISSNAMHLMSHPRVDKIMVLSKGTIVEAGTYLELLSNKESVFSNFLSTMAESGTEGPPRPPLLQTTTSSMSFYQPKVGNNGRSSKAGQLKAKETKTIGRVGWKVYDYWIRAAGGVWVPIGILFAFSVNETAGVASSWWLTHWGQHGQDRSQEYFLTIYVLINVAAGLIKFALMFMLMFIGVRVGRFSFLKMVDTVLHAPMRFFESTHTGTIINRFNKDLFTVDERLMSDLSLYLQAVFHVLGTVVVISVVTPIFLTFLAPLVFFYAREQRFFTITFRELKRMDAMSRSPILHLLGQSVDGLSVIRAFSAQMPLFRQLQKLLNKQQHLYFLTLSSQAWLAIRLELIATCIIGFACFSAVVRRYSAGSDETFAGLAGLAISFGLQVTTTLHLSVRMGSTVDGDMVALERIKEYSGLDQEAARETDADRGIEVWPKEGRIIFKDAKLRYRPGLPLALKGLSIDIPGGSKVGVVGRTGCGKSTLMIALMRIVELSEGSIHIDGQDIKGLGLDNLRTSISVIPQDPTLFQGTIRSNLDPFHEFSDEQLLETLERVGLYGTSHSAVLSLSDEVAENGANFSVGERQLLEISRAFLRGCKILMIDEGTASIDNQTDALIQTTIRTAFQDATCLTVAHRINTIMDSDYVLSICNGQAVQFDKPSVLLEQDGLFRDLVLASSNH